MKDKFETKIFTIKVDKRFYEEMGKGQVFEQLKNKAYVYFGSMTWNIEEGSTEEKGIIKRMNDGAKQENKTLWEKTKEKIDLDKKRDNFFNFFKFNVG